MQLEINKSDMMMKNLLILIGLLCLLSPAQAASCTISMSDETGAKGSTVDVPIYLNDASDIGNLNIILKYDPEIIQAVDVKIGNLSNNGIIEANTANSGEIEMTMVDSSGINGDVQVAFVSFNVVGEVDSTSDLALEMVSVNNLGLIDVVTHTEDGSFTVKKASIMTAQILAIALILITSIISLIVINKKK